MPFHKLACHETWQYCDGLTIKLHIISPKGIYKCEKLGQLGPNEKFIHVIPPNYWQAAECIPDQDYDYNLTSHLSIPPFDVNRNERGTFSKLIKLFPELKTLITLFHWDEENVIDESHKVCIEGIK